MRFLVDKLIDNVADSHLSIVLRILQFVSGLFLFVYAIGTFYDFHLAYPWYNLGIERLSQYLMILCAIAQLICGVFHCPRCIYISSWPAAVAFTYVAVCAKLDVMTDREILAVAVTLAGINWFVSSVSSRKAKRECNGRASSGDR
ncbi:MAG: hypothetical protein [Bacteriophage sp.]|nr:MAG: hypothetical protein [Bacteriophage sp.]